MSDAKGPSAAVDFIAGCIGGVAQVLSGHPLDTLKVRLQTQSATNPEFTGMVDCAKKIISSEGVMGLYKGMSSPLLGVSAINAVLFLNYGLSQSLLRSPEDGTGPLPMSKVFISGALAGSAVAMVESPFDLFKSKLQMQSAGGKQYSGVFDVIGQIWKARGLPGVYQGLSATLGRNVIGNTAYFYVYELAKRSLTTGKEVETPLLPVLFSGGLAGIAFWSFCYPLDIIKTKLQTDAINPAERRYSGVVDCFQKTLRTDGIKGLTRGVTPCLVRSFPANATCFLAYEYSKKLLTGN